MDTMGETYQISCSWCGGYSTADAMCEFCGSPLAADAGDSMTNDAVTVLAEATLPEPPLLSAPVLRAPVLSLPEPVVVAASRPVGLHVEVGSTNWIRYRRSLQVRWLIEAVTS